MILEKLNEADLEVAELVHDPIVMTECLFTENITNLEALKNYSDTDHFKVRLYQIPFLSFEYLIAPSKDLGFDKYFGLIKSVGSKYIYCGRKIGKSLFQLIDLLLDSIHHFPWSSIFSSFDADHIDPICEPYTEIVDKHSGHPFFRLFEFNYRKRPYKVTNPLGHVMESVNMTLSCFDDQTEILTNNGWRNIDTIKKSDKALSLNPKTEIARYYPINDIFAYDYDGIMYNIIGKYLNFLFTPTHKLFYNWSFRQNWQLKEINKFNTNTKYQLFLKHTFLWKGRKRTKPITFKVRDNNKYWKNLDINFDLWLEFLGWYLSEGCIVKEKNSSYKINICQSKKANPTKYAEIETLLQRMGLNYWSFDMGFTFSSKAIYDYLAKHCYKIDSFSKIKKKTYYNCYNKKIPDNVKNLSSEQIKILLDAHKKGDGCICNLHSSYYTASKQLADDIQELILKIGKGSSIFKADIDSNRRQICYHILELESKARNITFNKKDRKNQLKTTKYKGKVWCIEVEPYNLILIRREGKIIWTGNSSSPGKNFERHHASKILIDECLDGRTKIRCNIDGKNKTVHLSHLVNSGLWKKALIYSYNFNTKKIELKPCPSIFKKKGKGSYKIKFKNVNNQHNTNIIVSETENIYTDKGLVNVKDLKKGDRVQYLKPKLTRKQRSIILGCLLGDSHSDRMYGANVRIYFTQGYKQEEYLDYKKKIFKNFLVNFCRTDSRFPYNIFRKTSFNGRVTNVHLYSNEDFNEFYGLRKNKKICEKLLDKYFNKYSLAFWFMDDGSIGSYYYLHTEGFDLEFNKLLQVYLLKKLKINTKIIKSRKYFLLRINKESEYRFFKLIKNYIHPSLRYKLRRKVKKFIDLSDKEYNLNSIKISKIEKSDKEWTMYDLEVADNHNLFANNFLVHNSQYETEEVAHKRSQSTGEEGAIERFSGITSFKTHSPAGKIFDDQDKEGQLINMPQYVSPKWTDEMHEKAVKDYDGEDTIGFKIHILAEVLRDAVGLYDMERIRNNAYNKNRKIKHFEIDKDSYHMFKDELVLERPNNAFRMWLGLDFGEDTSEINLISEIERPNQESLYKVIYNITLHGLVPDEQTEICKYLIEKLKLDNVGIDATDEGGRQIYRDLSDIYGKKIVWVSFNEKIAIDFLRDEKTNEVIYKGGEAQYQEEYVIDWAVRRLKTLLYTGRLEVPKDSKFDKQFSAMISMKSGYRTKYGSNIGEDHYHASFQAFAIAEWKNGTLFNTNEETTDFCKTGVW